MFKRNYKYFVSFWYQLDNKELRFSDCWIQTNKKIDNHECLPTIRKNIKEELEEATNQKCNCVAIVNWKRIK